MQDKVWSDYSSLPADAQREAADFIAFLRQKYEIPRTARQRRPLAEEPVIGMWRDRRDLEDSTAWVREARTREWGEPGG